MAWNGGGGEVVWVEGCRGGGVVGVGGQFVLTHLLDI